MKTSFFTLLFVFSLSTLFCQKQSETQAKITLIETVANETVQIEGNITNGKIMEDLSWAWNSSVACFPSTQVDKYRGKHVLFMADVPRYSEFVITLIPDDPSANFSLYAYEVGKVTNNNLVPNLTGCIRCEVDHIWDFPHRGKTQDHTRIVKYILAINNPYQAVIGVVGPKGAEEGGFKLQIARKSK